MITAPLTIVSTYSLSLKKRNVNVKRKNIQRYRYLGIIKKKKFFLSKDMYTKIKSELHRSKGKMLKWYGGNKYFKKRIW